MCWREGVLIGWSVGRKECWSEGVLTGGSADRKECWSEGALVGRSAGGKKSCREGVPVQQTRAQQIDTSDNATAIAVVSFGLSVHISAHKSVHKSIHMSIRMSVRISMHRFNNEVMCGGPQPSSGATCSRFNDHTALCVLLVCVIFFLVGGIFGAFVLPKRLAGSPPEHPCGRPGPFLTSPKYRVRNGSLSCI